MGHIIDSTSKVEFSKTGSRNTVEAVTEVKMLAVRFTGDDGAVSTALLLQYGTTPDGKPNLSVYADEEAMRTQLKAPTKTILDGVRAWLSSKQPVTAGDIPNSDEVL